MVGVVFFDALDDFFDILGFALRLP